MTYSNMVNFDDLRLGAKFTSLGNLFIKIGFPSTMGPGCIINWTNTGSKVAAVMIGGRNKASSAGHIFNYTNTMVEVNGVEL